jgi:diguanylate cyclase (GGDEF)-like protein
MVRRKVMRQRGISNDEFEDLQRKIAFAEACADPVNFDQMLSRVCGLVNKWAQADVVTLILPPEEEGLEPMLHIFGVQPVLPISERSIRDDCAGLLAEMDYAHLPGEALRLRRGAEITPLHGIIRDDYMYRFWWQEMKVRGQSVGIVALYGFVDWVLSPRITRLLASVMPMLSRAINNAASIENLRLRMDRDELTGCLNQRGVFETMDRECIRAEEQNRELSVLLCEIEGFESIAGTAEGETFLTAFTEIAQSAIRGFDMIGRIADCEFVFILPEMGITEANEVVARVIDEARQLTIDDKPAVVSMGAVGFHGGTADALLQQADEALLDYKRIQAVSPQTAVGEN